jgi:hypothetical protein
MKPSLHSGVDLADRVGRLEREAERVAAVGPGHHLRDDRRVEHVAGERADGDVGREARQVVVDVGEQADRRVQADHARVRGREAGRAAAVRPDGELQDPRGGRRRAQLTSQYRLGSTGCGPPDPS